MVLNDEHSVNFVRVNGTLPMFNEWYDAFNITEDNILYVSPDKRAQLW
jgi:predicted metalloendopeptidase